MMTDENPVAQCEPYRLPDLLCPSCCYPLYSHDDTPADKQLSSSGNYCAHCIEQKLDTRAKRMRFLFTSNVLDEVISDAIRERQDEYLEYLMEGN